MPDLGLLNPIATAIAAARGAAPASVSRIRMYAAALATDMRLPAEEVRAVELAALLKDVGTLAVPPYLLSKAGPLTSDEFAAVRAHSQSGAEILAEMPLSPLVPMLVLQHHERWDGRGYPSGLAGESILLGARILAVVDYFTALTADRAARRALGVSDALALLRKEAGHALDPRVVDRFVALWPGLAERQPSVTAPRVVFESIANVHGVASARDQMRRELAAICNVPEVMARIAALLPTVVPTSASALFLPDEDGSMVGCRFAIGTDADVLQRLRMPVGQGVTGWVARERRHSSTLALLRTLKHQVWTAEQHFSQCWRTRCSSIQVCSGFSRSTIRMPAPTETTIIEP